MRKLLLIPAFMFLTLACEDEKEKHPMQQIAQQY